MSTRKYTGGVCKLQPTGQIQPATHSYKSLTGTELCSFVYVPSVAAFVL